MSQSTPRFQRSSMRISSAGLESPTVTLKSARLQHDQRKIVSQQLCPSKLGDRSVNRLYQFVSALLRVHTRNLCHPSIRVLFSCLILSFDRPVSVQNQNVSVAQIDLVTLVVRIGSTPNTGPPLSKGIGSLPARRRSGGLCPAFVYSKERD